MSYNDIAYSFSLYPKEANKNCKHLKELFIQAALQEEQEIPIVIIKEKKKSEIQK